jgi:hypothetical protein
VPSFNTPFADRPGVSGFGGLRQGAAAADPTTGEGRGVKSLSAARYGDARFDAEPIDNEDARLDADRFERIDEPMSCGTVGDVRKCREMSAILADWLVMEKESESCSGLGVEEAEGGSMFVWSWR